MEETKTVLSRFVSDKGEILPGGIIDLPINTSVDQLQAVVNTLLGQQADPVPLAFFVNNVEITKTVDENIKNINASEDVLEIVYQPQAIFQVRAVTRCTGTLEGHKGEVLVVSFSPDGKTLASGSGDTTLRLWDTYTQTPQSICEGHKHHVLCVSWSPCGRKIATACKNGTIILWNPDTGKQMGKSMQGHSKYVRALAWEPYHKNPECRKLVSASEDTTLKIWDVTLGMRVKELSGHLQGVTSVRWGDKYIYSASKDRCIRLWKPEEGVLHKILDGHGHRVNSLALNADYVLRIGPNNIAPGFNEKEKISDHERAVKQYKTIGEEKLVSGSDDFTLILWQPDKQGKPLIARMTGHQQLINDVKFSPDGRMIASASFDKSIKLWDGNTGKFIATFRGHVQAVYSVAWSADSRLLVSGSADSTLKVWSVKTKQLNQDLPGHADEVWAVDWAPDCIRVASGGKDKILRLWQN